MKDMVTIFDPIEDERVYTFPGGDKIALRGVTELVVRTSGTHELKTADGHIHIIPQGWIHIDISTRDWSI